ncbi:MAG: S24 family peptidase [Microscillaceae bacterium]|nr:S24 family peptidase [Microscillaceae bacterium]MDW8461050.1 S24 family peptidase [Cytophagales bacterium]
MNQNTLVACVWHKSREPRGSLILKFTISILTGFYLEKGICFLKNNTNTYANKSANFPAKKNANSITPSVIFSKTDINFSGERALQVLENEGLTGIKVYISPEPAMAGYLSHYLSEGNQNLDWFYMPFLQAKGLYACFQVQGRSMEEYILDGSWVIARFLEHEWQVRSGNLYLIATKTDGVLLKRIRQEPKTNQKSLVCYSDNPQYLPFTLPKEQVQAIWAVEMFLQKEFPFLSQEATDNLKKFVQSI